MELQVFHALLQTAFSAEIRTKECIMRCFAAQKSLWFGVVFMAVGVLSEAAAVTFAFQKRDVVAIYGNRLADQMQHTPWINR